MKEKKKKNVSKLLTFLSFSIFVYGFLLDFSGIFHIFFLFIWFLFIYFFNIFINYLRIFDGLFWEFFFSHNFLCYYSKLLRLLLNTENGLKRVFFYLKRAIIALAKNQSPLQELEESPCSKPAVPSSFGLKQVWAYI